MFDFLSDSSDEHQRSESSSALSVIGQGSTIQGVLDLEEDDLRVDGMLDGDVRTKGHVHVAEEGEIQGEVQARSIRISGRAEGILCAHESLILLGSSVVNGILCGDALTIEDGADFEGGICSTTERIPALKKVFSSTEMVSTSPSSDRGASSDPASRLSNPFEQSVSSDPDPVSPSGDGEVRSAQVEDGVQTDEPSSPPPEASDTIVEADSQGEDETTEPSAPEW